MKTVVADFIRQKNKIGQRITPIWLYEIQYDSIANKWLYWTSLGRIVVFDSQEYQKQVIKHKDITENSSGLVAPVRITIGNAKKEIQYYLDNYNGLKECVMKIKLTWLECLSNPLCFAEFEYLIEYGSADEQFAELVLGSNLESLGVGLPRRLFSRYRCQYADFKDKDCGYSGLAESCDRMFGTCNRLGNSSRIGAFPGVPMPFSNLVMKT